MLLRALLLVPAIGLLLGPAGAVAASQTPSAAGYSAADIPGLTGAGAVPGQGAAVGGYAAHSGVGRPTAANSGVASPAGANSAVGSATAACAPGASVARSDCTGRAAGCAVGDVAADPGSQVAGSMVMTAYDRDRYGAYQFDGYLNTTVLDQPLIGVRSAARGSLSSSGSAQLVGTDELQLSGAVSAAPAAGRAACVPNPCVGSASPAGGTPKATDSSVVLRLPVSPVIAEAGLGGVLLSALACGALLMTSRRRRRATRAAPW